MKAAIGLFGIHYIEKLNHWMGWNPGVDFQLTFQNNKNSIYKFFDTTFYFSTYHSTKLGSAVSMYNPKKVKVNELQNYKPEEFNENFVRRNSRFLEVIDLIIKSQENYDIVIIKRFDLMIRSGKTFFDLNVDYSKINFLNRTGWGANKNLCDDNFYVFTLDQLVKFNDYIKNLNIKICSHEYKNYISEYEINYMLDGFYYSHNNPFYYINRIY